MILNNEILEKESQIVSLKQQMTQPSGTNQVNAEQVANLEAQILSLKSAL